MSAKAKELVARLGTGAAIKAKAAGRSANSTGSACEIPPPPVSSSSLASHSCLAVADIALSPTTESMGRLSQDSASSHSGLVYSPTVPMDMETTKSALPAPVQSRIPGSSQADAFMRRARASSHAGLVYSPTVHGDMEITESALPATVQSHMPGSSQADAFMRRSSEDSPTALTGMVTSHPTATLTRMPGANQSNAFGHSAPVATPSVSYMAGVPHFPTHHAGFDQSQGSQMRQSAFGGPSSGEGYASAHGSYTRPPYSWPGYGYAGYGHPGFDQSFPYGYPPFHGGPPNRFPWPGNVRPSLPPTPPLHPTPSAPPALQEQLPQSTSRGAHDQLDVATSHTSSGDEHSVSDAEDDDFDSSSTFSFSDAIQRLAHVAPDLVSSAPSLTGRLSAAERILGRSSARPDSGLALVESPLIAEAFQAALTKVRGQEETPTKGSVPSLPAALPCGSYLKGDKPPFKKEALVSDLIPNARLPISREDLLLLPDANRQMSSGLSAQVKDKTLGELENLARCGLQSSSVLDSFLGGLVNSVKDFSVDDFAIKQDIDSGDFLSFIQALSETLKFTASTLSSLYVNLVLTRRDSILQKSQVLKNSKDCQASLRGLPIHSGSLFGGDHVGPTIHSLAESKRDLAFAAPRPPRSSSQPSRGRPFSHGKRSHSQSSPSSFASSRGGKSRSSSSQRKPYSRKQTFKASGKQQSPQ